MKTSLLLLVYHPPVSFSSYFFLLLCEDRKRKAKGNCFCIVDVPLRILKLKSWAERIFFRLRAATLTKEYQMKVGWKTATKSPTGTGTSLCNINSHFLPTSQFKASAPSTHHKYYSALSCYYHIPHQSGEDHRGQIHRYKNSLIIDFKRVSWSLYALIICDVNWIV